MLKKATPEIIYKRTNILRHVINVFAFIILLIAIYYLVYVGFLQFLGFVIFALILFIPRFIYKKINSQGDIQPGLTWVEILVISAIILNSIGYIWLFDRLFLFYIGFDTFAHFVTPILITLALAIIFIFYYQLKNVKVNKSKFILTLVVITLIYSFFWELVEYVIDLVFDVGIYGERGQPNDTLYDLIADLLSIPVISVIVYKYLDYINDQLEKIKKKATINKQ